MGMWDRGAGMGHCMGKTGESRRHVPNPGRAFDSETATPRLGD